MGGWMKGWMDGWMDEWMDGQMDGWMKYTCRCKNGRMNRKISDG